MQNLAAYSFSSELDAKTSMTRIVELQSLIDDWLESKGAPNSIEKSGEFKSKSGDRSGHFSKQFVESSIGETININLVETAHTGQIFSTEFFLIRSNITVFIFLTLGVTGSDGVVLPRRIVPRCPSILRDILRKYDDWSVGGWGAPSGRIYTAISPEKTHDLHNFITDISRNLPVLVINSNVINNRWDDFAQIIARDLTGLAYVYVLDDSLSDCFADEIGEAYTCRQGEVALYWPMPDDESHALFGRLWRQQSLEHFGEGSGGARRFSEAVREIVMSAAAQTLMLPAVAREIHSKSITEKFGALKEHVLQNELESIVNENFDLSNKVDELNKELADAKRRLTVALNSSNDKNINNKDEYIKSSDDESFSRPQKGDIIYYKKVDTKGKADVMVRTKKCNHRDSAWQPAFRGDKAENGIAKLEGRSDWKSLQHCGSCTGGGHWRVKW